MRNVAAPLALTGLQLLAALSTLRLPDAAQLAGFLGGGVPTTAGAVAVVELVLWLVVTVMFGVSVWFAARHAAQTARARARHVWGGAALLTGVCVLAVGLVHHLSGVPVTMAGGSLVEADRLAR